MTQAIAKSKSAANTYESGMISLGKYSLVNRFAWPTKPLTALLIALEKKIHGSNAENTKRGYGAPSLLTFATRENMSVYTIIMANGSIAAQIQPNIDCL